MDFLAIKYRTNDQRLSNIWSFSFVNSLKLSLGVDMIFHWKCIHHILLAIEMQKTEKK